MEFSHARSLWLHGFATAGLNVITKACLLMHLEAQGIMPCEACCRSQWQPAGRAVEVSLKIAGVHWWYNSRSHAAEMTAGYYNTETHDGYAGILELSAQHGMVVTLTCVEMCDAQHPPEALCGPEGLLRQVNCMSSSYFAS